MEKRKRDAMKEELGRKLDHALDTFQDLWHELGLPEEQKGDRQETVMLHLCNLLDEMVHEELQLKERVNANIVNFSKELEMLAQELKLADHRLPTSLSMLALEKKLREKLDFLRQEKSDRMKRLKRLRDQDQHLCDVLCATPYYIPSQAVPSKEDLTQLETHIASLELEKKRREQEFRTTKLDIMKLLEELDRQPNTSLERDIVCEEENSFLLSTENMRALKLYHSELEENHRVNQVAVENLKNILGQLWDRLEMPIEERQAFNMHNVGYKPAVIDSLREEIARCEKLKMLNMSRVIDAARKELVEWWDKCYFSHKYRENFEPFTTNVFTEQVLEQHDKELTCVKDYYSANRDLLEKVARRQQLWAAFLEFERKASDPNRFTNRGCNLLKEEKSRKKLTKELPKVDEDLKQQIEDYERRAGCTFLVHGQPYIDFINNLWTEFHKQKEEEKQHRLQARAKTTEEEMIYGSKPTTPAKRRFLGPTTPSRTPSKIRKLAGRRALADRNDVPMSQTTVSSQSNASLASVGHYQEFAKGLDHDNHCRSSVVPAKAAFF